MTSPELVQHLEGLHEAVLESEEYILDPCPSLESDRKVIIPPVVLEADVDEKLRQVIQNESRRRMSQRFSVRSENWTSKSIRIRVPMLGPTLSFSEERAGQSLILPMFVDSRVSCTAAGADKIVDAGLSINQDDEARLNVMTDTTFPIDLRLSRIRVPPSLDQGSIWCCQREDGCCEKLRRW